MSGQNKVVNSVKSELTFCVMGRSRFTLGSYIPSELPANVWHNAQLHEPLSLTQYNHPFLSYDHFMALSCPIFGYYFMYTCNEGKMVAEKSTETAP